MPPPSFAIASSDSSAVVGLQPRTPGHCEARATWQRIYNRPIRTTSASSRPGYVLKADRLSCSLSIVRITFPSIVTEPNGLSGRTGDLDHLPPPQGNKAAGQLRADGSPDRSEASDHTTDTRRRQVSGFREAHLRQDALAGLERDGQIQLHYPLLRTVDACCWRAR
jgi:hypothetical protein